MKPIFQERLPIITSLLPTEFRAASTEAFAVELAVLGLRDSPKRISL